MRILVWYPKLQGERFGKASVLQINGVVVFIAHQHRQLTGCCCLILTAEMRFQNFYPAAAHGGRGSEERREIIRGDRVEIRNAVNLFIFETERRHDRASNRLTARKNGIFSTDADSAFLLTNFESNSLWIIVTLIFAG